MINVGIGTPEQRIAKIVWQAANSESCITRWVCCEIIANFLIRAQKGKINHMMPSTPSRSIGPNVSCGYGEKLVI